MMIGSVGISFRNFMAITAITLVGAVATATTGGTYTYLTRFFADGKSLLANNVGNAVFSQIYKQKGNEDDICLSPSLPVSSRCEIQWTDEGGNEAFLYVGDQKIGQVPFGAKLVKKGSKVSGKTYSQKELFQTFNDTYQQLTQSARQAIVADWHPDATMVAKLPSGDSYVAKAVGRDRSAQEYVIARRVTGSAPVL